MSLNYTDLYHKPYLKKAEHLTFSTVHYVHYLHYLHYPFSTFETID